MAKKTETKTETIEREYVIPLRRECNKVVKHRRANKAVKAIKEFIVRHMKIRDRDLNKVKIDRFLNEEVWFRGIKKPASRIKVKAIKEGGIVRVELAELPQSLKFKKAREDKRDKKAEGTKKVVEKKEPKEEKSEEKVEEEKEKVKSVMEAGKEMEKAAAKQAKHMTGGKTKEPKHQQRVALEK